MNPIRRLALAVALLGGVFGLAVPPATGEDSPKSQSPGMMFKLIDGDRDDRISKSEFMEFAKRMPKLKDEPQRAQQAFNRLDGDSDGMITAAEFARAPMFAGKGGLPKPFAKPFEKPSEKPVAKAPEQAPEKAVAKPAVKIIDAPKAKPTSISEATARKHRFPAAPDSEGVIMIPTEWKSTLKTPTTASEIDAMLAEAQKEDELKIARRCADDIFLRRVMIDLSGTLPTPAELTAFVQDKDPNKREKRIDELLAGDAFSRRQARAWRDILLSRATAKQPFLTQPRSQGLEDWLFDQFKANRDWASITRDLLTAEGTLTPSDVRAKGNLGFLLAHQRDEGPIERANDAARAFLGVNIQCAQCHDAPNDIWKRDQFHQFAAFFGRTGERILPPQITKAGFQVSITQKLFGDHRVPDLDDAKKTYSVEPVFFLNGKSVSSRSNDLERRTALAELIVDGDNYYFPAAYVNRVWFELMGQAFAGPVDNLGPLQEVMYPDVMNRLAGSFVGTKFDTRALYRVVLNTQAYQRDFQVGQTAEAHLHFSGVNPTPLRGSDLWSALNRALGPINGEVRMPGTTPIYGRFIPPFRVAFEQLFNYDLSKPIDEIEGSVQQALMLMNNSLLNDSMKATPRTPLGQLLKSQPNNEAVIKTIYERTLGRRPTDRELATCRMHLSEVRDRATGFEDIQWSLINSTEFRTRR